MTEENQHIIKLSPGDIPLIHVIRFDKSYKIVYDKPKNEDFEVECGRYKAIITNANNDCGIFGITRCKSPSCNVNIIDTLNSNTSIINTRAYGRGCVVFYGDGTTPENTFVSISVSGLSIYDLTGKLIRKTFYHLEGLYDMKKVNDSYAVVYAINCFHHSTFGLVSLEGFFSTDMERHVPNYPYDNFRFPLPIEDDSGIIPIIATPTGFRLRDKDNSEYNGFVKYEDVEEFDFYQPTLQDQLEYLEKCGIKLPESMTTEVLNDMIIKNGSVCIPIENMKIEADKADKADEADEVDEVDK